MKKRTSLWLIIGILAFLLTGLGSGIGTFDKKYLADSLIGLVDWLAASIFYFFLGACIGLSLDLIIAKRRRSSLKFSLWSYAILLFIVVSFIALGIFMPPRSLEDLRFILSFPFMYGVFFHAITFFLLFPALLKKTLLAKLVLDIIYLGMFGTWFFLESKFPQRYKKANKILLIIIFTILTVGMLRCAFYLGLS